MKRWEQEQGFTLVEMLVGLAIVAIIATAVYSAFFVGNKTFGLGKANAKLHYHEAEMINFITDKVRPATELQLIDVTEVPDGDVEDDFKYIYTKETEPGVFKVCYKEKESETLILGGTGATDANLRSVFAGSDDLLAFHIKGTYQGQPYDISSKVKLINLSDKGIENQSTGGEILAIRFKTVDPMNTNPDQIKCTLRDGTVDMAAGNRQVSSANKSWLIDIDKSTGTVSKNIGVNCIEIVPSSPPKGLYFNVIKSPDYDNAILITVAGNANTSVNNAIQYTIKVKDSALVKTGATISEPVTVTLNPAPSNSPLGFYFASVTGNPSAKGTIIGDINCLNSFTPKNVTFNGKIINGQNPPQLRDAAWYQQQGYETDISKLYKKVKDNDPITGSWYIQQGGLDLSDYQTVIMQNAIIVVAQGDISFKKEVDGSGIICAPQSNIKSNPGNGNDKTNSFTGSIICKQIYMGNKWTINSQIIQPDPLPYTYN